MVLAEIAAVALNTPQPTSYMSSPRLRVSPPGGEDGPHDRTPRRVSSAATVTATTFEESQEPKL
jgi:hypothetical protein